MKRLVWTLKLYYFSSKMVNNQWLLERNCSVAGFIAGNNKDSKKTFTLLTI